MRTIKPGFSTLHEFLANGQQFTPEAKELAAALYNTLPTHAGYRNDGFYLAHAFNLDDRLKRESALKLVEICMAGYYESLTHARFSLTELLAKMEAMTPPLVFNHYVALKPERIHLLADKLSLDSADLDSCAKNVVDWCLSKYTNPTSTATKFNAGNPLEMGQTESLIFKYVHVCDQLAYLTRLHDAKESLYGKRHPGIVKAIIV